MTASSSIQGSDAGTSLYETSAMILDYFHTNEDLE